MVVWGLLGNVIDQLVMLLPVSSFLMEMVMASRGDRMLH